jgi:signal transduction histidine kinase
MAPIEIDRTLIRQALANLVDNAVNFTPAQGKSANRSSQIIRKIL